MTAKWTDFVSGAVLQASQLNDVLDNFQDIAIFNETQAANTGGGSFTAGSFVKRTLNTTVINNIGATLSSSVITLLAGTYYVYASAPATDVNRHKLKLRNTTDSTDTLIGVSCSAANGISATMSTTALLQGTFTIAASKNFELQHRCEVSNATGSGLGVASNFGVSEVYSTIQIVRIA